MAFLDAIKAVLHDIKVGGRVGGCVSVRGRARVPGKGGARTSTHPPPPPPHTQWYLLFLLLVVLGFASAFQILFRLDQDQFEVSGGGAAERDVPHDTPL